MTPKSLVLNFCYIYIYRERERERGREKGLYISNSMHILNYSGTPKIHYFRSECLSLPSPSASSIWIIISASCTHMAGRTSTTDGRGRRQNMLVHHITKTAKTQCIFNPLKTNVRLLYLKTQSVPRCKHFSSRL